MCIISSYPASTSISFHIVVSLSAMSPIGVGAITRYCQDVSGGFYCEVHHFGNLPFQDNHCKLPELNLISVNWSGNNISTSDIMAQGLCARYTNVIKNYTNCISNAISIGSIDLKLFAEEVILQYYFREEESSFYLDYCLNSYLLKTINDNPKILNKDEESALFEIMMGLNYVPSENASASM